MLFGSPREIPRTLENTVAIQVNYPFTYLRLRRRLGKSATTTAATTYYHKWWWTFLLSSWQTIMIPITQLVHYLRMESDYFLWVEGNLVYGETMENGKFEMEKGEGLLILVKNIHHVFLCRKEGWESGGGEGGGGGSRGINSSRSLTGEMMNPTCFLFLPSLSIRLDCEWWITFRSAFSRGNV